MAHLLLSLLDYQQMKDQVLLECGLPEKFHDFVQVELFEFVMEYRQEYIEEEIVIIQEGIEAGKKEYLPYSLCYFDGEDHLKLSVLFTDEPSAFEKACLLLTRQLHELELFCVDGEVM